MNNSYFKKIIFLAMCLLSFIVLSFLVFAETIEDEVVSLESTHADPLLETFLQQADQTKADSVQAINAQITDLVQQRMTAAAEEKASITADIQNLTKQRKQLMKQLARSRPKKVKEIELPVDIVQEIPEAAADIEQDTVEEGNVEVYHIDFLNEERFLWKRKLNRVI